MYCRKSFYFRFLHAYFQCSNKSTSINLIQESERHLFKDFLQLRNDSVTASVFKSNDPVVTYIQLRGKIAPLSFTLYGRIVIYYIPTTHLSQKGKFNIALLKCLMSNNSIIYLFWDVFGCKSCFMLTCALRESFNIILVIQLLSQVVQNFFTHNVV